MQRLADEIVESFGHKLAVVSIYDSNQGGFAIAGISPRKKVVQLGEKLLGLSLDDYTFPFMPEQSEMHRQLQRGVMWEGSDFVELMKPMFSSAMARAVQKALGVKGFVDVPLMVGRTMVGTLVVAGEWEKIPPADLQNLIQIAPHAALAVRQAILLQENAELAQRFRILSSVDREILSQKNQSRVLQSIVKNVGRVVPCDLAAIFLLDETQQTLVPTVLSRETRRARKLATVNIPKGQGVIGAAVAEKKAAIVNDAHLDPHSWYPEGTRPEIEHLICVPLLAKGKTLGALVVARFSQRRFVPSDLIIARGLAEKSALALENAQLLKEEKKREEELRSFQQSIVVMGRTLDPDAVLEASLREGIRLIPRAEVGMIFLVEDGTRDLYLAKANGLDGAISENIRTRWGRGLPGYVARLKKGIIIDDTQRSPLVLEMESNVLKGVASLIAVPLVIKGKAVGVLIVGNRNRTAAFAPRELSRMELLASHVSLTLGNARAHASAQMEVKKIRLINEIKSLSQQPQSVEALSNNVVRRIVEEFGYHHVSILLYNEEKQNLRLTAIYGAAADIIPRDYEQSVSVGMVGWTARHKKTRVAQDVSKDPYYIRAVEAPVRSELCVPIIGPANRLLGVLNIESQDAYAFSESDIQTMQAVASEIAGAIEETRLLLALSQSEKKYRSLVEYANDAIILLDVEGRFKFVNRRFVATTGYTLADVLDKRFDILLPPEELPKLRKWFIESLQRKSTSTSMQFEIVTREGSRRLIEFNGRLMRNGTTIEGILGVARDLTEHVDLQQRLQASEARYATFVQNTSEGIWRAEFTEPIDSSLPEDEILKLYHERVRLVEINPATCEMYGCSDPEQLLGRNFRNVVLDWERYNEAIRQFIRGGFRLTNWESVDRSLSGETKYFLKSYVGELRNGFLVGMWGSQTDVTDRKRMEHALQESEKKYRELFERSRDAIFISTPAGRLVDINQAGVELFGYDSKEELLKVDIKRDLYVRPEDRDVILSQIEQQGFVKDVELRLRRKSGEEIIVLETGVLLQDRMGTVIGYQGILRDITKQKRAQEEIQAWRQRYDLIVASSGQVAYEYDVTTGSILWSGSVKDVLGYTPEEMSHGINQWIELIDPQDRDRALRLLEEAERELKPYDVEYRFRKKDGTYLWMHDRGFFIAGPDGKPQKMLGMMEDIDTQKKLQSQLLRSEQRYRTLFEHANDAVLLMKDEMIVDCNPQALQMFGFSRAEMIGHSLSTFSPPFQMNGDNSLTAMKQRIAETLAGNSQQFTWRHVRRDGSYFQAEVRLARFELEGEVLVQAQIRDITEQLLAQEELARSEENYRSLIQEAGEAIFVLDGDGAFVEANEKACKLLGYSRSELLAMNITDIVDAPREEAMTSYRRLYHRLLIGESVSNEPGVFMKQDGRKFPYEMSAALTGSGMFQAIIRDVSERHRAEEELNRIYSVATTSHGQELFENAARTLADLLDMQLVGIGELKREKNAVLTHVLYEHGAIRTNEEMSLAGTACEEVVSAGGTREYQQGVRALFPHDPFFQQWNIESYLGTVMVDSKKETIGLIVVADPKPHRFTDHEKKILSIIAQRLASELEMMRQRAREEQLSAQLLQAQKMESLGRLAGGVAHDFNNILAAILGYASLMKRTLDPDSNHYRQLEAIEKSSQRAAALARQLLSFAKSPPMEIKPLNINDTIRETVQILESSFPKTIVVKQKLSDTIDSVEGDHNQISQLLMNLFINARDAILDRKDLSGGGEIQVSTYNVHAGQGFLDSHFSARSGDYVCLVVSDNGVGMNRDVQQRIFEPFYTTKEKGRGTGLGLSVVYGIVRNHNGFIDVYSEVGRGTTFKIYFPASGAQPQIEAKGEQESGIARGSGERILVVEDETVLRELVSEILEGNGYRVITAANGREAIEVYRREGATVDLVLLDMIMPEMDGPATFEALRKINPDVRVLISSGFSQDMSVQDLLNRGASGFVGKPYRPDDLLHVVATTLQAKQQ